MNWSDILLDPRVLVTFIICAILAAIAVWAAVNLTRRRQEHLLKAQQHAQEETISRVLDSFAKDKDEIITEYESKLRQAEQRLSALEKENARLKERLAQGGFLGMFGGRQRDVVSALLLENEQLHELLEQRQTQMREMVGDLTGKLLDRLDEQIADSNRAIRYKQVLLSAFLQQQEVRGLLDRFLAEGRITPPGEAGLPAPIEPDQSSPSSS